MHFASPYYLWLLTALVPMAGYYVWRTLQGGAAIQISSVDGVVRAPKTIRYYLRHLPFVLRAAAFALLVVALARPQDVERLSHTNTEGIDIMLAIDVSGSMLARDFRPDRITAAKEVAGSFIADRYGDRIGLVAFAGEAFTQSPLTKTLRSIAEMTGGEYFRATDKAKLKAIYDQINQMEKSKVKVTEHVTYHEQYLLWALAGLLLLFAEFLFANLVLKRIP